MLTFNNILNKYREFSFSERDKGDRFERLMQAYLQTDPQYAFRFKKVWLWKEFFGKKDLGGNDTGIDLVALTIEGDYWAIQCKCYAEGTIIDKPAIDGFLSTSSRHFKNEELKTVGFSQRLWIDTTGRKWGSNAEEAIINQHPPVSRLRLNQLQEAPVDWEKLEEGVHGEASRSKKKTIRQHQKTAMDNTHEAFKTADRGKLIMACGTGKTFTSLRIAENETNGKGLILFLVPSIALLGQTLREWATEANEPINAICICSDPEVSKKKTKNEDNDNFSVVDLALPASTNVEDIIEQFNSFKVKGQPVMTVVFSTYQSIEVIAKAQKELIKQNNSAGEFDLIICDEAHRTTGVSLAGEDESSFTKVHDNNFIKAKKRLYMTATPRLYSDDTKSKAAQAEAILCSMDDPALYGEEIYRIGFGEAVNLGLLTDYKVLILTLSDKDVPPAVQKMIADKESEINADDASKLIGCINALSKQILGDAGILEANDPDPMHRAVAFCQSIAASKKITATYNTATEAYIDSLPLEKKEQMVSVSSKHIDGTMSAPARDELLGWLKAETANNECRVLTNVRCLSEGVDVPSLDAVMFLSARNSQIDVVQSVGRVMRLSPGTKKKYGYIIIPVVVPSNIEADKGLDDNERYKVVWTVLNALRAHDDRFNATINKIELNKSRPEQILVGRPEYSFEEGQSVFNEPEESYGQNKDINQQLALQFEQLQHVIFARMVQKVGDRLYWEQWAKSVAQIAERQVERIARLIKEDTEHQQAFADFLNGLQKNINPSITQQEAVEMLSQHIITKPVFEALFEGYSFVKNNPISVSMQTMIDLLEGQAIEKDTESLQKFYDSVRMKAQGIDNAEGKQRIIIELYDKFFKTAFPKMVEKLGIVYTPVEVVDFIIRSVNDVLKKEFDRTLSDENVNILDPFTGTGTFITRLLQSGLINQQDLRRKYQNEIFANEIVLLAYYIAAVNIENAYHDAMKETDYLPFDGICLTDTFQLGENDTNYKLHTDMFPQNSERVAKQKNAPLKVIFGNPPYSIGQKSANDNAQNQKYNRLDSHIVNTYVKESKAGLNRSLYDAYIRAFRWASDRLDPINGGVIAFVSNAGWIDGFSLDGFRKCIAKEFTSIYVMNLRGNGRTSGERCRQEGEPLFAAHGGKGGSLTPISISFFIKNPQKKVDIASIFYHDIGMYLKRSQKLGLIKDLKTINNIEWLTINPNEEADWINQRKNLFGTFLPLESEKKFDIKNQSYFVTYAVAVNTGRDAWTYNFSTKKLQFNISRMIDFFNEQRTAFASAKRDNPNIIVEDFVEAKPDKISWTRSLRNDIAKNFAHKFNPSQILVSAYRPFCKQRLYFNKGLIEAIGLSSRLFPNETLDNKVICISQSANDGIAVLISNNIANFHYNGDTQCFPLYYFDERQIQTPGLFDSSGKSDYIRRDGVTDFILERAHAMYGKNVEKLDVFYYVYGFLHNINYRSLFGDDLRKMLPRLPLLEDARDFWKFSKAGRELAELHINYEAVPAYEGATVTGKESGHYYVEKMRFPKKDQRDTIIFNSKITISNIPAQAYEYVVNGKSAIEWIMERYQITTHKESGIRNDPNDWATEVNNPRYILDLLLSVINVSVKTTDIVKDLPVIAFE